jgi:ribosomal protein S13
VFFNTPGLGNSSQKQILRRLELPSTISTYSNEINSLVISHKIPVVMPLNIIFSQINSVNNQIPELKRLNTLRLYLIRSYRGKCHALGKPVKGQRT